MSEREQHPGGSRGESDAGDDEPRQPARLSPEEIERIEAYEEIEEIMQEPPEGELGIISDEDIPGAPG